MFFFFFSDSLSHFIVFLFVMSIIAGITIVLSEIAKLGRFTRWSLQHVHGIAILYRARH